MIPDTHVCHPGDTLRITQDKPYGTTLATGDLVTVAEEGTGIHPGPPPIPVVVIHSAYGKVMMGVDALEPYTPPTITPAEPDEIVNAFFFRILGNDAELREWAVEARTALAANDPTPDGNSGGVVTVQERPTRRRVGQAYSFTDSEEDELEVAYYEDAGAARNAGFLFVINDDQAVVLPVALVDGLLRYLFHMKKHSERPADQ